jgi:hypothetical protein
MDCSVRVEHHVLHQIFGIVMVPAVLQRQQIEAAMVLGRQGAKRLGISTLGSRYERCFFGR